MVSIFLSTFLGKPRAEARSNHLRFLYIFCGPDIAAPGFRPELWLCVALNHFALPFTQ